MGSVVYNHPIGRKNTTYIPLIVLAFVWGLYNPYQPLQEPEKSIDFFKTCNPLHAHECSSLTIRTAELMIHSPGLHSTGNSRDPQTHGISIPILLPNLTPNPESLDSYGSHGMGPAGPMGFLGVDLLLEDPWRNPTKILQAYYLEDHPI